jgi:hypothetical protein
MAITPMPPITIMAGEGARRITGRGQLGFRVSSGELARLVRSRDGGDKASGRRAPALVGLGSPPKITIVPNGSQEAYSH